MGLIGGAFRATRTVTRTTYRAGRSIANGRVPSLGIGLSLPGGFGARIGTRGISLRTPIGRQSVGLSGFRTTVGVPGIAHVTLNPLRPSLTAGLGPARISLAKNPGAALVTRFVAVGVTTQPLIWASVGSIRFKLPGKVQAPVEATWHEELDKQWQVHYERRPPSVSYQLHHIIRDMESAAMAGRPEIIAVPQPSPLPRTVLPNREVKKHRRAARRAALRETSFFARAARREARANGDLAHEQWARDEQSALDAETTRLNDLLRTTFEAWKRGEPHAVFVLANALLGAGGGHGTLVSLNDTTASMIVFAPPIEEVHPYKPSITKGGAPSVTKRTKQERLAVHMGFVGASTLSAVNSVGAALRGVQRVDVTIVAMSSSTGSLADCPVISAFSMDAVSMRRGASEFGSLAAAHRPTTPTLLRSYMPGAFSGHTDALAVATMCESIEDLRKPEFWIEARTAIDALSLNTSDATSRSARPRLSLNDRDRPSALD